MQQTVLHATMCLPYLTKDVKTAQRELVMTACGHDDEMSLQCWAKPASHWPALQLSQRKRANYNIMKLL